MTHNDLWPSLPLDGVPGPFTKIKKTTGRPCSNTMTAAEACYETLGFTDADGFSDNGDGNTRVVTQRGKEYEYTHSYAASTVFQPHKLTLIVRRFLLFFENN